MRDYFEYKGYLGSAEVDVEGKTLVGKLLFIHDVIAYSANDFDALEKEFHRAVDDYIQTCLELGDEPDKPCKGTFNVRIGPTLHREVALCSRKQRVGLNDFVRNALTAAVQTQVVEHVHNHQHSIIVTHSPTELIVTTTRPAVWEEKSYATKH